MPLTTLELDSKYKSRQQACDDRVCVIDWLIRVYVLAIAAASTELLRSLRMSRSRFLTSKNLCTAWRTFRSWDNAGREVKRSQK